ncbi:hypothetical protein [Massilia violaceinigra]|uniref:hypothetical protein n=1 Tax=Massilia violaceinigra TaxID=2045208 RepID=UPI0012FDCDB3|nr:hypothetical protein [Massilia violaceinigra]
MSIIIGSAAMWKDRKDPLPNRFSLGTVRADAAAHESSKIKASLRSRCHNALTKAMHLMRQPGGKPSLHNAH